MKGWLVAALAGLAVAYVGARLLASVRVRRYERLTLDEIDLPGQRFYVRGRGIHLTIEGHGPPLLLLHGFGASNLTFRELAPRLRDEYTLIAPDLLGFGFSDRSDDAASHDAQALLMLE